MKLCFERIFLVYGIFSMIVFNGCAGNVSLSNASANSANIAPAVNSNINNPVKDDFADFKQYVNLAAEPDEIVWREEKIGASDNEINNKRKIVAVLRFLPEDTPKINEKFAANGNGKPSVIETEDWYPAELIAQSQISGDETIKGITFSPGNLAQTPFTTASVTRIENSDYFIFELSN